ncbi:MAG TPA: MmcQ/YjbR family DNA-binding protein [Verrucomicrobiae bacterium]|nr:MmcQ/YjbR family DNA-binding protein [Verrucomicrobiae bacterium]
MNIDRIRQYCLNYPEATENLQWGDDLCFKIHGKIFAIVSLTAVPQKVCFKCHPETFAELIEREDIHPAPYVGRYKWVMLDRPDAVGGRELEDLIRQSYEIVAAKAPTSRKLKAKKPVAPKKGPQKQTRRVKNQRKKR